MASKAEFHPSVRAAIERRSGGKCEVHSDVCTGHATLVHHKLRRSHGGQGVVDNALATCNSCHLLIHGNPAMSYEKGWMIRSTGLN